MPHKHSGGKIKVPYLFHCCPDDRFRKASLDLQRLELWILFTRHTPMVYYKWEWKIDRWLIKSIQHSLPSSRPPLTIVRQLGKHVSSGSRRSVVQEVEHHISATQETLHQQNVECFGSHNWTTQPLWTATLILPDAPRHSQIGCMQSDVLPGAPRLLHQCTSMLRKLCNRIKQFPQECVVVPKMLQNQNIRMCKFQSNWEYWPCLKGDSCAPQTWSHTLREWLL